jgi:hypothetical protein
MFAHPNNFTMVIWPILIKIPFEWHSLSTVKRFALCTSPRLLSGAEGHIVFHGQSISMHILSLRCFNWKADSQNQCRLACTHWTVAVCAPARSANSDSLKLAEQPHLADEIQAEPSCRRRRQPLPSDITKQGACANEIHTNFTLLYANVSNFWWKQIKVKMLRKLQS